MEYIDTNNIQYNDLDPQDSHTRTQHHSVSCVNTVLATAYTFVGGTRPPTGEITARPRRDHDETTARPRRENCGFTTARAHLVSKDAGFVTGASPRRETTA